MMGALQRQWRQWWRTGRLVGLALLAGLLVLHAADPAPVEVLRLRTFDLYQRLTPFEHPGKPVMIVDIDEKSLAKLGQWPWPRHYIAKMVGNLANAGAKAIGFDMVFGEKDPTSGAQFVERAFMLTPELKAEIEKLPSTDAFFGDVIRQSGVVVLGQATDPRKPPVDNPRPPRPTPVAQINGDPRPWLRDFGYLIRNIPELERNAPGVGMFVLSADIDDTVRRVPAVVRVGEHIFPTLALEMLRVAVKSAQYKVTLSPNIADAGIVNVGVPGYEIPTDRQGRLWVRFARHDQSLYVPAADIILDQFDPQQFAGKLVLVGTSAVGLRDLRTTPVESVIPGVEVHAQLLKSLLLKQHLVRMNGIETVELVVILLTGFMLIALIPNGSAFSIVALFASLLAAMLVSSWYLLTQHGFLVDASFAAFSCTLLFVVLVFIKFMREASQRREIRAAFSHYLAPEMVNRLAEDPSRLKMGGETREMTFLFSDVHGFTSIAERFKADPQGLTRLINQLLTPLTARILANRGTIDKYMGDCVMAFWNAPIDDAGHAVHACEAALDMLRALDELNRRRQAEAAAAGTAVEPLKVGIGINTGECVVGNMGSDQRFDYTVLGDAVNLASRLESQSRTYGVDIVVGDVTAERVAGRFALLQLDLIAVKGKAEAVRIYTIVGDKEFAESDAFRRWHAAHDALIAAYRARQWDTAEARLAECRALADGRLAEFYALYAERIAEFRQAPPETGWDGVYRAVNK